jgi:multisubunit Na+/H+ antiporter MnhE subunit
VEDARRRRLRTLATPRAWIDLGLGAGVWLLLAGSWHPQEVVAALIVGALVAYLGVTVRQVTGHRGVGFLRFLPALLRMYARGVRDCWTVSLALLRRPLRLGPQGRLRRVPFEVGGSEADAASRRALATLSTSLQPNTYVIGFDRERDVALVHELVRSERNPIDPGLRGDV